MRVLGLPHRLTDVKITEVEVNLFHAEPVVEITAAFHIGPLTAGRISVQSRLLSEETMSALRKFIELAEKDVAATVFEVIDEPTEAQDPEPVNSL